MPRIAGTKKPAGAGWGGNLEVGGLAGDPEELLYLGLE